MGYGTNVSNFNTMRAGNSSPYGAYLASLEAASQTSSAYGLGGVAAAEMYAVRGGFGAVDSYGMAAASYAGSAGYGYGMSGLGAYAASYYSGYQSAFGGAYGLPAVQGAFQGAYAAGALSAGQYQTLQGWGQDIAGMQAALGAYGGSFGGVGVGIGAAGSASVEVLGRRITADFGVNAEQGMGFGTFGSGAYNSQGQFQSLRIE
jgi:hypothetical protein